MADIVQAAPTSQDPHLIPVPFIDLVAQHQTIKTEVMETVNNVFEEQRFVLGEEVEELEKEIAAYCDSREAIACASGTDALVLSLMALNVGPGDEVITSPFTFFATAGAIYRVGAHPVFVDIEPGSFNINPELIESAITPQTKAIMPVHIFGQCADMDPIWRLAVRDRLAVIEDACQAIGAEYNGRRAGVLGRVGCFSFFPTKNLGGAGDGGIMTTDDVELAKRLRRLRVHGDVGQYRHTEVGINSRLDALQAAVLRIKLGHLDDWSNARGDNASRYEELIAHYELQDVVTTPQKIPEQRHVYNQYTTRVSSDIRDTVVQNMRALGVGAAIYYPQPLHLQECFENLGYKEGDFPESEKASAEVISLPIFAELTIAQQESVVRGMAYAVQMATNDGKTKPLPAPLYGNDSDNKIAA